MPVPTATLTKSSPKIKGFSSHLSSKLFQAAMLFNHLLKTSQFKTGAGNETRTRDIKLGKLALYQLSYARISQLYYQSIECLSITFKQPVAIQANLHQIYQ
jgi:hypothetical protein